VIDSMMFYNDDQSPNLGACTRCQTGLNRVHHRQSKLIRLI